MSPTHIGEGSLSYQSANSNVHLTQIPSQTHPEQWLAKCVGTLWSSEVDITVEKALYTMEKDRPYGTDVNREKLS